MSVDTLTWPLRIARDGRLAVAEQDLDEDLVSCAVCILKTPQGWCTAQPDFGRPADVLFRQGGVDVDELTGVIEEFEPRSPSPSVVAQAVDEALAQTVSVDVLGGE